MLHPSPDSIFIKIELSSAMRRQVHSHSQMSIQRMMAIMTLYRSIPTVLHQFSKLEKKLSYGRVKPLLQLVFSISMVRLKSRLQQRFLSQPMLSISQATSITTELLHIPIRSPLMVLQHSRLILAHLLSALISLLQTLQRLSRS